MKIGLDFDGTILDSKFRHVLALKIITGMDLIFFNDFLEYKSNGKNGLNYLREKGFLNYEEIFNCWMNIIENDELLKYDILFYDSLYFLEELSKKSELYLVSKRKNVPGFFEQLHKLNIFNFFSEVIVVGEKNHKYEVTKDIKFDFIIGDTEIDLEWAINTNSRFFALNRGFRSKVFWDSLNIESFENLLVLLKNVQI